MQARCFSGSRLRTARTAAGLRPEEVAQRIRRSVYSIHEYERGRVRPPVEVIDRLAGALSVSMESLLDSHEVPVDVVESSDMDQHVQHVVDNFPRMTDSQRTRIATLLSAPAPRRE